MNYDKKTYLSLIAKGKNERQSEIKKLIRHNKVMLDRAMHQTGTADGLKATPSELRDSIVKMLALIHYIEKP